MQQTTPSAARSFVSGSTSAARGIIERSGKVVGVFAEHEHEGGRSNENGVSYYTLRALVESGRCFEVGCYPYGVSVFGM